MRVYEVKPSGMAAERKREGERERGEAQPGCCTGARWGEEPRDRDLFISRRARVRSYILPLPPSLPPSLRLSTCSRSLPTFLSFSFFSFPRSVRRCCCSQRSCSSGQREFLLAAEKHLSLGAQERACARLLLSKYEFKIRV